MTRYRVALFVVSVLALFVLSGLHHVTRSFLSDMRFNWGHRNATGDITVVAIDSPSIKRIGVWPWPRSIYSDLIKKLEHYGVTDIVFDIDFSSAQSPAEDGAFAKALEKAGGSVVLPSFKQFTTDRNHQPAVYSTSPLPIFKERAWSANVNVAVDPDGRVRRYPYGAVFDNEYLPSIGALIGGEYGRSDAFWIDYSIAADSIPKVSFIDVLSDDPVLAERLKGKKVIIGATAIELGDRFNVPNGSIIPGAVLQALAGESILQGRALHPTPLFVSLLGLGLIALVMTALWTRCSARTRATILVVSAVAIEVCATVWQTRSPVVIDTSLWHAAIAGYFCAVLLHEIDFRRLLEHIGERRFNKVAMSVGEGLICADREARITMWNPAASAMFGYDAGEMIGRPLSEVFRVQAATAAWLPFLVTELPNDALQAAGGQCLELLGQRRSGEVFPIEACLSAWDGADGCHYSVVFRDISLRKREAERLKLLAERDTLTGLANRHTLHMQLCAAMSETKQSPSEIALLVLDLDRFKQVNDTLGHGCGDQLLCAVANRLKDLAGPSDLAARISGDEFAILLRSPNAAVRAKLLAQRASVGFEQRPLEVGERAIRMSVSIGVALYPEDGNSPEELLGAADLALYQAKTEGRARFVFFQRKFKNALDDRLELEAALLRAVENKEFELFYQPQINLENGALVGAEALIRWWHPQRGLVLPGTFIPVANASSISDTIAMWAMETACRQAYVWQSQGRGLRVGINLSPSQFLLGDLPRTVERVLRDTRLPAEYLELEVTENILLADDESAIRTFREIRELGVRVAFDDFGTGYASLSYLKKFALDVLKIDKSFICDLRSGTHDAAIVRSTISLGRQLGMAVIAEGIEAAETADILRSMGCDEGQGFYFGKPMPAKDFEKQFLMGAHRGRPSMPVERTAA